MMGKAQEVCTALSLSDSSDYDKLIAAVLQTYELVPEAYRQKFIDYRKTSACTFMEFAMGKTQIVSSCLSAKFMTLKD